MVDLLRSNDEDDDLALQMMMNPHPRIFAPFLVMPPMPPLAPSSLDT